MPQHKLILKQGVIVMLLRNLDPKNGMCNGTRLIVKQLHRHVIEAEILQSGKLVFIPRIVNLSGSFDLPFILCRRQFPCSCIICDDNQQVSRTDDGEDRTLLATTCFSVTVSSMLLFQGSRSLAALKVQAIECENQGMDTDNEFYTQNVVYPEVLN